MGRHHRDSLTGALAPLSLLSQLSLNADEGAARGMLAEARKSQKAKAGDRGAADGADAADATDGALLRAVMQAVEQAVAGAEARQEARADERHRQLTAKLDSLGTQLRHHSSCYARLVNESEAKRRQLLSAVKTMDHRAAERSRKLGQRLCDEIEVVTDSMLDTILSAIDNRRLLQAAGGATRHEAEAAAGSPWSLPPAGI